MILNVKHFTFIRCIMVIIFSSGCSTDYKIGICCFMTKHAALRSKSKDWLARNQDNVS